MTKTQKKKLIADLDKIIITLGFLPGTITLAQIERLERAIQLKRELMK